MRKKQTQHQIKTDYYPFGWEMPGRKFTGLSGYRYGFNGMEKDDEIKSSDGTSYDFGARMYDSRIGRWLSLDPLAAKFASESPYLFVGANPTIFIDSDGRERTLYITVNKRDGTSMVLTKKVSNDIEGEWKSNNSGWGNEPIYTSNDIIEYWTYDAKTKEITKTGELLITRETGIKAADEVVNDGDEDYSQGGWHISGKGGSDEDLPKGEGDVEYKEGMDDLLAAFGALNSATKGLSGKNNSITVKNNKGATERLTDGVVEAANRKKKAEDHIHHLKICDQCRRETEKESSNNEED